MTTTEAGFFNTTIQRMRRHARQRRAAIFHDRITLRTGMRILDLGGRDGKHMASILVGSPILPSNVFLADINHTAIKAGQEAFGFTPVCLNENDTGLPFRDGYFDIVFCSSVIEHVTVPKCDVWTINGDQFRRSAAKNQSAFAREIRRVGKQIFVQTPYRYFPIESHCWLPFVGWLPRQLLIPTLRIVNRSIWPKKTSPDWHLLGKRDMKQLFPDAKIVEERFLGLTKSIIAIQADQ